MRAFGVDEAGKGPVLGSMFAAAVVADPRQLPAVADSKRLAPERRQRLAADLRADDGVTVGVAEVPVERIDDPETDMNALTVAAHARALEAVPVAGLAGVLDAGDVDADRFARRVADRLDVDAEVTAAHRADETDRLVAAASILAKVERDAHVAALAAEYGDLGSGYPSDPTTRAFLREYVADRGELPPCARATWQTSRDVLAAAEQSTLDSF
jgi:ribonuclease HII